MEKKRKDDYISWAKYANLAISFGLTMLVTVSLGYLGGNWLDKKLNTSPFLMILGILLGIGISFYSLWQEIMFYERTERMIKDGSGEDREFRKK